MTIGHISCAAYTNTDGISADVGCRVLPPGLTLLSPRDAPVA